MYRHVPPRLSYAFEHTKVSLWREFESRAPEPWNYPEDEKLTISARQPCQSRWLDAVTQREEMASGGVLGADGILVILD